jgi:hypothetical protein
VADGYSSPNQQRHFDRWSLGVFAILGGACRKLDRPVCGSSVRHAAAFRGIACDLAELLPTNAINVAPR